MCTATLSGADQKGQETLTEFVVVANRPSDQANRPLGTSRLNKKPKLVWLANMIFMMARSNQNKFCIKTTGSGGVGNPPDGMPETALWSRTQSRFCSVPSWGIKNEPEELRVMKKGTAERIPRFLVRTATLACLIELVCQRYRSSPKRKIVLLRQVESLPISKKQEEATAGSRKRLCVGFTFWLYKLVIGRLSICTRKPQLVLSIVS